MVITLGPEIEKALAEEACRRGTTPELLAVEYLRARFLPNRGDAPNGESAVSLAAFLADHIGVLSSSDHVTGGARMSEEMREKFAKGLMQKRQKGQE